MEPEPKKLQLSFNEIKTSQKSTNLFMHLLFLIHVQVHFIEGKEVEGPPSHRHINTIKKETKVGGGRWRLKCSSTKKSRSYVMEEWKQAKLRAIFSPEFE